MTGNPSGPMNLAENPLPRSHAHGRRQDPEDRDVKTMQDGLRQFAPGVQMTVRNPATHRQGVLTEQEAFELLATLSLLARFMERCEVRSAESGEPKTDIGPQTNPARSPLPT